MRRSLLKKTRTKKMLLFSRTKVSISKWKKESIKLVTSSKFFKEF